MVSPDVQAAMRDFPPVVYVPCNKMSTEPGPDGRVSLEILMRMTRDGRVALLAYSALDRFHSLIGRTTDWALLTHDGLDEVFARQPFDLLLMDVEVPADSREDGQWLSI